MKRHRIHRKFLQTKKKFLKGPITKKIGQHALQHVENYRQTHRTDSMNFVSVIKSVFGKKSLTFSINNENELKIFKGDSKHVFKPRGG